MANKYTAKQLDNDMMLVTCTGKDKTVKVIVPIADDIDEKKIERKEQILKANTVPAAILGKVETVTDKTADITTKLGKVNKDGLEVGK